ncbi:hypothetical protein VNO77_31654 [Canavalia gladiata]|uniref:Uncharacterized protein n=1 Tax=Canavalia gladiata TaxID=3824 RepID=A0AAN9Q7T8_CANGL
MKKNLKERRRKSLKNLYKQEKSEFGRGFLAFFESSDLSFWDGISRFKELNEIVKEEKYKLETEIGLVSGGFAKMAHGIVSKLPIASDIQKLCSLAIKKVDEWLATVLDSLESLQYAPSMMELTDTSYRNAKLYSLRGNDITPDLSSHNFAPDKHRNMYMTDSHSSESYEKYFLDSPIEELIEPSSSYIPGTQFTLMHAGSLAWGVVRNSTAVFGKLKSKLVQGGVELAPRKSRIASNTTGPCICLVTIPPL